MPVDPLLRQWAELRRREEKRLCEDSLIEFFKRSWREIDPAALSVNWHHEVIAEYLEGISLQELRHLVINIPPRHGKTIMANIIWPAWIWAQPEERWGPLMGPHVKFLTVSYAARLAEDNGLKMLRLVNGAWYQSHWGHQVRIRDDQASRANFGNERGGERMSNSIEGGLLGRGGDVVLADDPHSLSGAESDAQRESTLRAFSEGLSTRITDPRIAARILIMQRVHNDDCTNWALENWPRDTAHLMFPARFETARAVPQDARTIEGELLWPEVWTEQELSKIERGLIGIDGSGGNTLSNYAVSAQLQQSPVPRGGAIIDRSWWKPWPEEEPEPGTPLEYPDTYFRLAVLDTAMSERTTADYNALAVFGLFRGPGEREESSPFLWRGVQDRSRYVDVQGGPRAILMEAWRMRGKLRGSDGEPWEQRTKNYVVERVLDTCRRRMVDRLVITTMGRSKDVADELARLMQDDDFTVEFFDERRHGDKVARLTAVSPLFTNGRIYAPEPPGGKRLLWVDWIIGEVASVPFGQHDDGADCVSGALIWLRESGMLSLEQEHKRDERRRLAHRPRVNLAEEYGV